MGTLRIMANVSANFQPNQTKIYSFNSRHTGRLSTEYPEEKILYSSCVNYLIIKFCLERLTIERRKVIGFALTTRLA